MPRKLRAMQKRRSPGLARPSPGATQPPCHWPDDLPDAVAGLKGTSICRAISDQGRIIRLPGHLTDSISRVHYMRHVWVQMYEEEPTTDELSKLARVSEERLNQIGQLTAMPTSLDWLLPDGEHTPGDQLPDSAHLPCLESLMEREPHRLLHHSLSELTPRKRHVLRMHFGIGQQPVHTLEEIGRKLHLTRERIRQIEVKALKKLRHGDRRWSPEGFVTIASDAGKVPM